MPMPETMEKLRLQVETLLNEATRRAYAAVGRPEAALVDLATDDVARLPETVARDGAAGACADQAAAKFRQGGPGAVGERRGVSADVRPSDRWSGSTVPASARCWHAALIERLRALNLRILPIVGDRDLGGDRGERFPRDVIHQYVPYDCRATSRGS